MMFLLIRVSLFFTNLANYISHRTGRYILLSLALLIGATPIATASKSPVYNGFFYRIQQGERVGYLYGTTHIGKKSMYPLPSQVLQALDRTKVLAVEVEENMENQNEMAISMVDLQFNLEAHISPTDWQQTLKYCARDGIPPEMIRRFKPVFAAILFTLGDIKRAGYSPELGIDRHLERRAKAQNIPVVALESAATQLAIFDVLTLDEQLDLYSTALKEMAHGDMVKFIRRLMNKWQRGDEVGAQQLTNLGLNKGKPYYPKLKAALLADRNLKMVEAIDTLPSPFFVAVGAGHLLEKEGLVELFRRKGYQITRQ